MRILVTGGAGFIGSHLVRRLLTQGHRVINLDALKYSGNLDNLSDVAGHPQYGFVQADICDQKRVREVMEEQAIEGIINCAAETHVDRSIVDPGTFARTRRRRHRHSIGGGPSDGSATLPASEHG